MAKQLKFWNGRGHGKYVRGHMYVTAYTQKQAAELLTQAVGHYKIGVREIQVYYYPIWGDPMDGVKPTQPGVWVSMNNNDKPRKVL